MLFPRPALKTATKRAAGLQWGLKAQVFPNKIEWECLIKAAHSPQMPVGARFTWGYCSNAGFSSAPREPEIAFLTSFSERAGEART